MPYYQFRNRATGEIKEVFQKMNDKHEIGYEWERLFSNPRISFDTKIDHNSAKDFVAKTAKRGMTIGEMMDLSGELSEKRGGSTGKDAVRASAEKKYRDKTGKVHPHAKRTGKIII